MGESSDQGNRGRGAKAHFQDETQDRKLPMLASIFWKHVVVFYASATGGSFHPVMRSPT